MSDAHAIFQLLIRGDQGPIHAYIGPDRSPGQALCGEMPNGAKWDHVRRWDPPSIQPIGICPACWEKVLRQVNLTGK